MRYTIGEKKEGGALVLVKVWRGETLEKAAEAQGCTVLDQEKVFANKRDGRKALRALQKERNPEQTQWYNPAGDQLIAEVGKLHPGDGHTIKVSVKDQGHGPKVLVQRSRLLAGNVMNAGSLGRLPSGAARRLAKLLQQAADQADNTGSDCQASAEG
jgi:hypothetical protein